MSPDRQSRTLRLGTRASRLAIWQAEWVAGELRREGCSVELVEIVTHGDLDRTRAIEDIGTTGVFTKAIQHALLYDEADIAVHSLKDLPTEPMEGLVLAAVAARESPSDVIVSRAGGSGAEWHQGSDAAETNGPRIPYFILPREARVGTGSFRRQAQLRHTRADLVIEDVRGNVETRLRKLDEGRFDALVLAQAGLRRLGMNDRVSWVLPFELMLPAVGQGALGIECRADDEATLAVVRRLNDAPTFAAVAAERALLARLRGGCMAPIGAIARVVEKQLKLQAAVLSLDGATRIEAAGMAAIEHAAPLGEQVADWLLADGAAALIATARR